MSQSVKPIRDQSVTVQARATDEGAAVVELAGVLGHRDPGPLLAPFFEELHRFMIDGKRRKVTLDLRRLRFMNSASFKHLVTWLKTNGAEPPESRYHIHFLLNPIHHWQEVSVHALGCFSADAITTERLADGD